MTSQEPDSPAVTAAEPQATPEAAGEPIEKLAAEAAKAPSWFAWVAILTIVNSVCVLLGLGWSFFLGLGATQVVDAIVMGAREELDPSAAMAVTVVGVLIDLFILGLVALVWWLSKRGSTKAYMVGMVCYGLDGLLFLAFADWFGLAFHAFFLVMMIKAYGHMRAYHDAMAKLQHAALGSQTPPLTPPAL